MIKRGRTWLNLVVDMVAIDNQLRGRIPRILAEVTGAEVSADAADDKFAGTTGASVPVGRLLLLRLRLLTGRTGDLAAAVRALPRSTR